MDEIIIECLDFDPEDKDQLKNIYTEVAGRMSFPPALRSRTARQRLLEDCGPNAFLDPAGLRHPVMNPKTCDFDCQLLNKAYYELSTCSRPGSLDLKSKAKSIMEDSNCRVSVQIKLQDDINIELDHLNYILT